MFFCEGRGRNRSRRIYSGTKLVFQLFSFVQKSLADHVEDRAQEKNRDDGDAHAADHGTADRTLASRAGACRAGERECAEYECHAKQKITDDRLKGIFHKVQKNLFFNFSVPADTAPGNDRRVRETVG